MNRYPANNNMVGTHLVEGILTKFPEISSLGAARLLYAAHPAVWPNQQACRYAVQRARGKAGKKNRAAHTRPFFKTPDPNPFGLPDQSDMPYPLYMLEGTKVLLLSDVHVPYQDNEALTVAIKTGVEFGADAVFLNGDIMDFYQLSRFNKDPRERSFVQELKDGRALFNSIRYALPDAKIYWKLGNHEERYQIYLWNKAPELLGLPGMSLPEFMKLEELDVKIIPDKLRVKVGKLTVLHGHEIFGKGTGGVNPARGAYLNYSDNVVIGHFHRTSQHSETTVTDRVISCWSTGCLCQLHPYYARLNKWNLGFALIEVVEGGAFSVHNKRIYEGKVW